jgi:hypothetical protein
MWRCAGKIAGPNFCSEIIQVSNINMILEIKKKATLSLEGLFGQLTKGQNYSPDEIKCIVSLGSACYVPPKANGYVARNRIVH